MLYTSRLLLNLNFTSSLYYILFYVNIGNLYFLNTLFMYGFCCPPPLQSLFLAICTHFTSYSFMSRHMSPILIYFSPTSSSSSMLHISPKRIIDARPKWELPCNVGTPTRHTIELCMVIHDTRLIKYWLYVINIF